MRRLLAVEDKTIRILTLKVIRYTLEVCPSFGALLKLKLIPMYVCKLFEDHKHGTFEERLEVKLYNLSA
jgi:hypothetical protein